MSVPTLSHAAVHAMFLPNRKGTAKRDNKRRAKAHRMALESVRGDVDTTEPASMQFSRGQRVNLKKLRQEAARSEQVEKCNRKLVDKMMMIMQGLCGTIISEQTFPDFNPGTLNYRIRQRELMRIDRDNMALLRRLGTASSGYNKALLKPKHFQEPHMGLFPRSDQSVKSAGSKLRKRTRPAGSSTAPSDGAFGASRGPGGGGRGGGGHGGGGGGGHGELSVTSVLTEPSAFPTTTLGKFHDASSTSVGVVERPAQLQPGREQEKRQRQQRGDEGEAAEVVAQSRTSSVDLRQYSTGTGGTINLTGSCLNNETVASAQVTHDLPGYPTGEGSVDTVVGTMPTRIPHPPSISSRASCGSTSGKVPSTLRRCRRLAKPPAAKPGSAVFKGGVRIGDDYAFLTVTRAVEGFGEDGTQGFWLQAYFPLTLSVYTTGVSSRHLPAFVAGSSTAVRQMFKSGEKSRRRWERLASFLELRPTTAAEMPKLVGTGTIKPGSPREAKHAAEGAGLASTAPAAGAEMAAEAAEAAAAGSSPEGLGGTDDTGAGANATGAAAAAAAAAGAAAVGTAAVPASSLVEPRFEMLLVQPQDAPVIMVQKLVRGRLTREIYRGLKRAVIVIQAFIRGWKYRMAKRRHEAATKIAAVSRGRRTRGRVKQERAARGIQKRARVWLREQNLKKEQAATKIQGALRHRQKQKQRLQEEMQQTAREESLFLVEQPKPAKSAQRGGGGGATSRTRGYKDRVASPHNHSKKRSPRLPETSNGNTRIAGKIGVGISAAKCSGSRGGGGGGKNKNMSHLPGGEGDGDGAGKAESLAPQTGNRAKGGGGGGRGGGAGGGGAGRGSGMSASKAAITPPRNQRPRPPDTRGFSRSPYNRSQRGWTRATGGGRLGGSNVASSTARSRATPESPTDDSRRIAAEERDVSVASPPRDKSPPKAAAAVPKVAGAWPSGGAGTRAAIAAEAGVGNGKPASAAKKGPVGKPSSPRSAGRASKATWEESGGRSGVDSSAVIGQAKWSGSRSGLEEAAAAATLAAAAADERREKQAPPELAGRDFDNGANGDRNGESGGGNSNGDGAKKPRQLRSSSIPLVEEATIGKHYQPPPKTAAGAATAPHRRTSSVSWAEDLVVGMEKGPGEAKSAEEVALEEAVAATSRAGSDGGNHPTPKAAAKEPQVSGGGANTTPYRRTSSASWAEDLVAGMEKGPNAAKSAAEDALEEAVAAARRAGSDGGNHPTPKAAAKELQVSGGGANTAPYRRTSSASWAEDLVAGMEKGPDAAKSAAEDALEEAVAVARRAGSDGGNGNENSGTWDQ